MNSDIVIVAKAIKPNKSGKSDCMSELKSDHLLQGPNVLLDKIACLFTSMILHGYSPFNMKCSSIIPIMKNSRKSSNDSENFQCIAISSLMVNYLTGC